jgi:hypothetical protein
MDTRPAVFQPLWEKLKKNNSHFEHQDGADRARGGIFRQCDKRIFRPEKSRRRVHKLSVQGCELGLALHVSTRVKRLLLDPAPISFVSRVRKDG